MIPIKDFHRAAMSLSIASGFALLIWVAAAKHDLGVPTSFDQPALPEMSMAPPLLAAGGSVQTLAIIELIGHALLYAGIANMFVFLGIEVLDGFAALGKELIGAVRRFRAPVPGTSRSSTPTGKPSPQSIPPSSQGV